MSEGTALGSREVAINLPQMDPIRAEFIAEVSEELLNVCVIDDPNEPRLFSTGMEITVLRSQVSS
jgi:hypothetical protein